MRMKARKDEFVALGVGLKVMTIITRAPMVVLKNSKIIIGKLNTCRAFTNEKMEFQIKKVTNASKGFSSVTFLHVIHTLNDQADTCAMYVARLLV